MVTQSGISTMPLHDYVNDPAPKPSLNTGTAHALIAQSPQHAWVNHPRLNPSHVSDRSSRLDLGTIAHAMLLERDESRVVVIEADDWRTKEAKTKRDEARAAGLLPILAKDFDGAKHMVTEARLAIAESQFHQDFKDGIPEETLIWEQDGIWHRSRPDIHTPDWKIVFDYKTTQSAHPAAFMRTVHQQAYDLQAELALQGVEQLTDQGYPTFVFIVQEIEEPYAVSFLSLSPQWHDLARQKLRTARSIWKGCLRKNVWPSYTKDLAYIDPPAYASIGWDESLTPIDAEDFV